MKVQNMTSPNGNRVANQFIIFDSKFTAFQSYDTIIVKTTFEWNQRITYLDENAWNYSKTTAKYRNLFLGCTSKECKERIKNGTYILADLNSNN